MYSIPRIDQRIYSLDIYAIFFLLDANRRYWQVNFDNADRCKTASNSRQELIRFIRMMLLAHSNAQ